MRSTRASYVIMTAEAALTEVNSLLLTMRDLAEEALSPAKLRRDGFFDPAGVRALLHEHLEGRADHRKPLWSLIAFQLWREHYLT